MFLGNKQGFPDKWRNLNFNDRAYIASDYNNYKNWKQLKLPSTLDDVFKTEDFNGAILFRKSFTLHEIEGDNSIASLFNKRRYARIFFYYRISEFLFIKES